MFTGSTLHALKALSYPRWEDFTYELADPVENRFYWLGDGQTHAEKTLTGDSTFSFTPTSTLLTFVVCPTALTYRECRGVVPARTISRHSSG